MQPASCSVSLIVPDRRGALGRAKPVGTRGSRK
jgi:hypothetical protein